MAAFGKEHDLHRRRFGRNLGLGLVLAAFAALVFGLTVVKVSQGDPMQAFDHAPRPEMATPDTVRDGAGGSGTTANQGGASQ